MRASCLFTSEPVSEGHPDEVCDRISGGIVDLFWLLLKKIDLADALKRAVQ
jgi:S-adenosylmethionine synthetase